MFTALLLSLALLGSAAAAPYYSDTADLAPWASAARSQFRCRGKINKDARGERPLGAFVHCLSLSVL